MTTEQNKVRIFHNGRASRCKISQVIGYVEDNAPELVHNNRIELGKIQTDKLMYVDQEDVLAFIVNTIKYGIVMDAFKTDLRGKIRR